MSAKATIPIDVDTTEAAAAAAYDACFVLRLTPVSEKPITPKPVWVTNEEVERQSAKRRAEWQAEIERRPKFA